MLTKTPRVRISGHGKRLRAHARGDWRSDPAAALRESCRSSVAVEKALAEAIHTARVAGLSWDEIGRTLGVAEHARDKDGLVEAWAAARRTILAHQLRNVT